MKIEEKLKRHQIIFIALGSIIFGVVIWSGLLFYTKHIENSNRDLLVKSLVYASKRAQEYFITSSSAGGGGRNYLGWSPPVSLKNSDRFTIDYFVTENHVSLDARGIEIGQNDSNVVRVTATVSSSGFNILIRN